MATRAIASCHMGIPPDPCVAVGVAELPLGPTVTVGVMTVEDGVGEGETVGVAWTVTVNVGDGVTVNDPRMPPLPYDPLPPVPVVFVGVGVAGCGVGVGGIGVGVGGTGVGVGGMGVGVGGIGVGVGVGGNGVAVGTVDTGGGVGSAASATVPSMTYNTITARIADATLVIKFEFMVSYASYGNTQYPFPGSRLVSVFAA